MIRVCYIPHGKEYSTYIKRIAEHLKNDGIEFVFVTKDKAAVDQIKKDGFEVHCSGEIFDDKRVFSPQELFDLDLRYGPHGIRALCNSDVYMQFFYKKQEDREQLIARAYIFWKSFFDEHKIDYILMNDIASFDTRTAYNVSRAKGKLPTGIIWPGPGNDYFTVCDVGEEFCWSELLNALSEEPKLLTDDQRKVTFDFIKDRIERNQWIYSPKSKFMTRSIFPVLREMFGEWKMAIDETRINNPVGAASARYKFSKLKRKNWWRYVTQKIFPYDEIAPERYVYFPIFYENEIANKANYHYWTENQFSMIKEVAESLPAGINLYVKEHSGMAGNSSYMFLKKIRRIPNVKVIRPFTRGQLLIDNCEAVVLLNGTSGWEAYLSRKPVVVFGTTIFYARSRLVYKIASPCELPVTMFRVIKAGSSIYDKNESEWFWFIYSVISTAGQGTFCGTIRYPEENLKKMAKYIGKKVRSQIHA